MDRLAAMETFVRVVDAGSFSGAAKLLRVGQPAVSKTVAQLEKRLGVRLLLRSSHGLKPTEAGRNFYQRAKRSIEEAEEADLAARGAAAALSGCCASRLPAFTCPTIRACRPSLPSIPSLMSNSSSTTEDRPIEAGTTLRSVRQARRFATPARSDERAGLIGTPAYFMTMGSRRRRRSREYHAVVHDQQGGGTDWMFQRRRRNIDQGRRPGMRDRCRRCAAGRAQAQSSSPPEWIPVFGPGGQVSVLA